MKNLIIAISALLLTIVAIFLLSYNKYGKGTSCNPQAIEQISFYLMGESLSSECFLYKFDRNGNYGESAGLYGDGDNENLFQLAKKYCLSKNLPVDIQLMAVVLYMDFILSQSLSVSDEHIKGISLYEVKGNKIMHRLYVRNEKDDFYEEENVHIAVPYITANHINFYLKNYVFTDPENKSDIVLGGTLVKEVWENIKKYKVPMRYERKPRAGKEENS